MKFRFVSGKDVPEWVLAEVSVLSRISCVRLKLITRQVINELAGDGALDVEKVQKLVPNGQGFAWTDIKAALAAISYILRQAVRADVDHTVLGAELQQLGLPKENSDGISRPFRIHRVRLREQARANSLRSAPRLVSLDWTMDVILASSRLGLLKLQPRIGEVLGTVGSNWIGEPILKLRLGLSHDSNDLPQRFSAVELSSSRLLLNSKMRGESSASTSSSSTSVISSKTSNSTIVSNTQETVNLNSDTINRPRPIAKIYVDISLSSLQLATLLSELKIARNLLKQTGTDLASGSTN
jgi:COMM domain containing 4